MINKFSESKRVSYGIWRHGRYHIHIRHEETRFFTPTTLKESKALRSLLKSGTSWKNNILYQVYTNYLYQVYNNERNTNLRSKYK